MPWNIKLNDAHNIIELTYSGLISPTDLKDAFSAAVALSKKEGASLFLADCTEMIGGHSISDLYSLIVLLESVGLSRRMKEALLLPSLNSTAEDVKFYETACLNRGFNVKIFHSAQDAITWLKKSHASLESPSGSRTN